MSSRFEHAGLVGKFQADGIRETLEKIARFLVSRGLRVSLEAQTARNTGIDAYPMLGVDELDATVNVGFLLSSRLPEFAADIGADVAAELEEAKGERSTNGPR